MYDYKILPSPITTYTGEFLEIYKALVPITLAFSYLVKKGGVVLSLMGINLFLAMF